ncbi:sensor histidine kinase [Specibacter cremeus]|uniref:sensor histidine kinase n=1 Tax=Specibacter cremeus TaxID=1629051 RepID=UPI000F7B4A1F|nr:sensor histidine kinase [Specibacter cremeus]
MARWSRGQLSLAGRLFGWQLLVIAVLTAVISIASYQQARAQAHASASLRVLSVATTLAHDPFVAGAVTGPDPTASLQPFTQTLVATADVDFVTIMSREGIRYTHPNPGEIGGRYQGTITTAQAGKPLVEDYVGTLGPSVRAIVPVVSHGKVVAMVAVGFTLKSLETVQAAALPSILLVAGAAVVAGAVVAWLLSRRLRRATLGYGPAELARLFDYYDSALHALREGLVLIDARGRLALYNDHAADLLALPPGTRVTPAGDLDLPPSIAALFASGRTAVDEVHLAGTRLLVISQRPTGGGRGTVVTLRDHTELRGLAEDLHGAQTLVQALRSQTHEHANHLHAIASLLELGHRDEALVLATAGLGRAHGLAGDAVGAVDEPYLSALLLGKDAEARERGIDLVVSAAGSLPPGTLDPGDLITILGNLIDNAMDAVAGRPGAHVWVDLAADEAGLLLTVADDGPGLAGTDLDALARIGASSKPAGAPGHGHGYGLALVRRAVAALGGTLTVEDDGGAVFTVSVPVPDPAAPVRAEGGAP